jgi:uncharacterized membrane protein
MPTHVLELTKATTEYAARAVEFAASVLITIAALQATVRAFALFLRPPPNPAAKNEVRLTLARWLALALEFELAADILNTAVTPTWSDIEKLAAIAAIRTALNYFLGKEIDAASDPVRASAALRAGPEAVRK